MADIPVRISIEDGRHFSICPTTVEATGDDRVIWEAAGPFVVHFIDRSPCRRLDIRSDGVKDRFRAAEEIRGDADSRTYEYAVGIFVGGQVFVHVSGEVRKYP